MDKAKLTAHKEFTIAPLIKGCMGHSSSQSII